MGDNFALLTATTLEAIFTIVMYGADKIPDSWFDKVPGGYFRTKEDRDKARKQEKKEQKQHRRRSEDDGEYDDEPNFSDDLGDRRGRHQDSSSHDDDGYDNDYHRRASGQNYGARKSYDGARHEDLPLGIGRNQPRPYRPAEYAEPEMDERQAYYNGRSQGMDGTRFVAPGFVAGATVPHYDDRNARPKSSSGPIGGYIPYAYLYESEPPSSRPTKLQRDAERYEHKDRSSNGSDTTRYPRNAYVESASESHHSRSSDGSRRHHHSERDDKYRPRARSTFGDRFNTTDQGLGYGTIGALAGGLLGNEVGRGGILPSVAGAVAGGLGANAYEGRNKHHDDGHRSSRHDGRHEHRHEDRHDDRERNDDGSRRRHRKHRSHRNDYHSD